MTAPVLSIKGLTKAYPGVVANSDVSFDIQEGEVHALLGENGAGKSTLVKMIYGLVKPDAGSMTFQGRPYAPAEPRAARGAGVAMVFQHFSLFDALNVAENIALGMENPPRLADLAGRIRAVSETYGLPLDPFRTVGDLSAGERQRVEIIRCLLQDPRLLIMDEPTSVLTPQEVEILFETLRKLTAEGVAILYISHKLEEIRALCDTATILRLGKKVATCTPVRDHGARIGRNDGGHSAAHAGTWRAGFGRCGTGIERAVCPLAFGIWLFAQGYQPVSAKRRGSGAGRRGRQRAG
jgi:general nucleoside transport system ATP-binding protein